MNAYRKIWYRLRNIEKYGTKLDLSKNTVPNECLSKNMAPIEKYRRKQVPNENLSKNAVPNERLSKNMVPNEKYRKIWYQIRFIEKYGTK